MFKFDLGDQLSASFGNHRSGWAYAISSLRDLHEPTSLLYLDTFVERTYVWGQRPSVTPKAYIPTKPWVGFIHVPPFVPHWFDQGNTNERIFSLPEWQRSYQFCQGLFVLSEYHKQFLTALLDVPIDVVYHPMDNPNILWTYERFEKNPQKSIVQIGWWLRLLHAIFELPSSSYKKIFLKPRKEAFFNRIFELERVERKRIGKFRETMYDGVDIIDFLPNNEYDQLLACNIAFAFLYDASANNLVLECIARHTPLLINRLPPVVEYLGPKYPLYYSSYDEALDKADNHDLLRAASAYLAKLASEDKFSLESFRGAIVNSPVVRSVADEVDIKNTTRRHLLSNDPVIYIVTPCLNAASTIDATILSIITQSGDFSIRYHVQDGGSSDFTIERLKYWESVLSKPNHYVRCNKVCFTWASESDEGVYDALLRGFDQLCAASDEFMCWLNADDVMLPGALSTLCLISIKYPEIDWITGPLYRFRDHPHLPIGVKDCPIPTEIVRQGLCDSEHWSTLQQEGTFFRKRLWFKGKHVLGSYKLAGDWALWREFAKHASLAQVTIPLGAFRKRAGQLSVKFYKEYMREIDVVLPRRSRIERLYRLRNNDLFRQLLIVDSINNTVRLIQDSEGIQQEVESRIKSIDKLSKERYVIST